MLHLARSANAAIALRVAGCDADFLIEGLGVESSASIYKQSIRLSHWPDAQPETSTDRYLPRSQLQRSRHQLFLVTTNQKIDNSDASEFCDG
jgi:hypothetical protein